VRTLDEIDADIPMPAPFYGGFSERNPKPPAEPGTGFEKRRTMPYRRHPTFSHD
jgi:hypothetical protein